MNSADDTKLNGKGYGVFVISIDDGFVEWSYDMDVGEEESISSVERKIRKALRSKKHQGCLRRFHLL